MKKILFEEPDQNASDMTVFKGWEVIAFIVFLFIMIAIIVYYAT